MKRILIASPISNYKDYILPAWLRYVKSIVKSYNSSNIQVDILLCDNSQNANYHKSISRAHKVNIIHLDSTFKNSRNFICDSRNVLRDHVLNGNYDFMLSLECDVFPPEHFLTQMLSRKKHVISLPYFIGEQGLSMPMVQLADRDVEPPRDTRLLFPEDLFQRMGTLFPVYTAGLGCTLISRAVLEKFEFRWDNEFDLHDDSFFADDLYQKCITWWIDATMICRHLNVPWNYFPKNKL